MAFKIGTRANQNMPTLLNPIFHTLVINLAGIVCSTFSEFSFFRLIFRAPFSRLLDSFKIIFINPRIVTSNDALDEFRVLSKYFAFLFDVVFAKVSGLLVRVQH